MGKQMQVETTAPHAFPKSESPEVIQRPLGYKLTINVAPDTWTSTPYYEDPLDPRVIARQVSEEYAALDPTEKIMTDAYRLAWAAKRGAVIAIEAAKQLGIGEQ